MPVSPSYVTGSTRRMSALTSGRLMPLPLRLAGRAFLVKEFLGMRMAQSGRPTSNEFAPCAENVSKECPLEWWDLSPVSDLR